MIHPDIILKKSKISGKGLFAKNRIPRGTIVWRLGDDRVYTLDQFAKFSKNYQKILRKFGYELDSKIVYCSGIAKYWNHSCSPNTAPCASLNEEMDIVIKDIEKDEEVTYDLGICMERLVDTFRCSCLSPYCRSTITRLTIHSNPEKKLRALSKNAERLIPRVRQPLLVKSEIID